MVIFSEVIHENLVTNFNNLGVLGSVVPKDFGLNAIQKQEYSLQFNCHTYYLHW